MKHYWQHSYSILGCEISITYKSKKLNKEIDAIKSISLMQDYETANYRYIEAIKTFGHLPPLVECGAVIRWHNFRSKRK